MLETIIGFIKDKNKNIVYCIFMVLLVFYISEKYWRIVLLTYTYSYSILMLCIKHILSIAFVVMSVVGVKIIFNLSDRKSKENIDEYYEKGTNLVTHHNKYFEINLIEMHESFNKSYGDTLKVIIKNTSNSTIDYIKGTIFLYDRDNERIKNIKFEIKNLRKAYKDRVFYDLLNIEDRFWEKFDAYVDEFKILDEIHQNFNIRGKSIIRSNFLICNYSKFYDHKIFGIRTKYNLAWIKEKVKYEFFPAIKFFYSQKKFYFHKRPVYIELKDLFKRLIRFLVVIFAFILILSLIFVVILDIGKLIISIIELVKLYFQQFVKYM